ncbi:hypothetical protein AB0I85_21100 [Micromonospora echinofusca]|uniref:hypothetical protein n=1 Tax=Micromonospora echinofusca TaxID=47858 RepID=UPI003410E406
MTESAAVDQMPPRMPPSPQKQSKTLFGWQALPYLLVALSVVLAGWLSFYYIQRAGDQANPPSQLEQALFGIFSLAAGAILSWLTSAYYSSRQARDQFQQLARPALRRVTAARDSAESVLVAIERRRGLLADSDTPVCESLTSLYELVEQHARVLDDAIEDWQEVLPEDVRAVHAQEERRAYSRLNSRFDKVEEQLADLATSRKADPEETAKQVSELQKEVGALRKEVQVKKGRELATTKYGGLLSPSAIMADPQISKIMWDAVKQAQERNRRGEQGGSGRPDRPR